MSLRRSHDDMTFLSATPEMQSEDTASVDNIPPTSPPQQYKRRERYSGKYPRNFKDKYKEKIGDEETINKVSAKGMTPAGTHVPIMVKECLHYMGLDEGEKHSVENGQHQPLLIVDCTLGYRGHSSCILNHPFDTTAFWHQGS